MKVPSFSYELYPFIIRLSDCFETHDSHKLFNNMNAVESSRAITSETVLPVVLAYIGLYPWSCLLLGNPSPAGSIRTSLLPRRCSLGLCIAHTSRMNLKDSRGFQIHLTHTHTAHNKHEAHLKDNVSTSKPAKSARRSVKEIVCRTDPLN